MKTIQEQIIKKQDELIHKLQSMVDSGQDYDRNYHEIFIELFTLKSQLQEQKCHNIYDKVKESNTPDKRTFEEAEQDKQYLNECIEKAEPNLSKIKDVDETLREIKGEHLVRKNAEKILKDNLSDYYWELLNQKEWDGKTTFKKWIIEAMHEFHNQFKNK
jgi:hypothetical protein